ncbi:hypothetical protein [Muricoccus aerilatus]|uniref:hypothetical protein n=1 Tax=Muricoccus aerilatus TaxID=452982 RepID=UPI0006940919|nr:hypothetical protein [Roseomonas aerilata]
MPVIHKLDGLIAWTRRAEWREVMAETLVRHVAKACAGADLEIEDLWDFLDDADQGVIWGAAFEDLLASDLPDGRNLADDYLKRCCLKEPVVTQEYIAALRHSVISLYEVSEVVPGESMLLRDLVRPSEPVRVLEKAGTRSLRQWDRVATRVIPQRSVTVISGTLLAFDQDTSEQLLASLRRVRSKAGARQEVWWRRSQRRSVGPCQRNELTRRSPLSCFSAARPLPSPTSGLQPYYGPNSMTPRLRWRTAMVTR